MAFESEPAGRWKAFHIHYLHPQDALIAELLQSLIADLKLSGLVAWFFIRYWEQGPHIRVRLRIRHDNQSIETRFRSEVQAYMKRRPSISLKDLSGAKAMTKFLAESEGKSAISTEIMPDNSLHERDYEPEIDKYGGTEGIAIAEHLFHTSSDLVVSLVRPTSDWDSQRLVIAVACTLLALRAAGLSQDESCDFLSEAQSHWARYVSSRELDKWHRVARERQPVWERQMRDMILIADAGQGALGDVLHRWQVAVAEAFGKVDLPGGRILQQVKHRGTSLDDNAARQFLLLNYIHMHNNRVGLSPAQEACAMILSKSVVGGAARNFDWKWRANRS